MLLLLSNLLMVLFGFGTILFRSSAEYSANYCPNSTTYEISNATFRTNLNVLLSVLVANASQSGGFYSSGMGRGTINAVDGQLLCRGDVSPSTCQECAAAAATEIKNRCPNKTESIIWYDECEVSYTYRYYAPTNPGVRLFDDSDVSASDLDSFNSTLFGLLERLGEEAAGSDLAQKFATGDEEFGGGGERSRVYGLAQCMPDMTAIECGECLRNASGTLPVCCGGKQGARSLLARCNVRYQLYQFYNTTSGTSSTSGNKGSARKIVLIVVVLVVILIIIFCCACYFLLRKSRKNYRTLLRENFGAESATVESLQFSLATIETATRKFSSENKIGDGGFGEVYKGILSDGREIAVKKLSKSSGQGVIEFKNEIILIAKLQHRNLVALLGFCLEEQEKMLIYEFVPNKSLDYFLFDPQKSILLNWLERNKIIEGIVRGILYLHEHSRLKVIHRDLKPSNILLDGNMNPKISDFGMARIVAIDQNQGKTNRIVGTYGYMSPEYAMYGQFSEKSDVFSFGVIILEIISAKKNARSLSSDDQEDLLTYAWRQWRDQTPLEILDQDIKESCNHSEVIKCIQIGLLCVQEKPDDRPTMANVVSYLSSPLTEMPFPGEPTNPTHSGVVQNMVAGSTLSINEMSVTVFIPR